MTAPRFLLDTNILVYLIAGERDLLRDRVQQHEPGTIVTSTLCVAEARRFQDVPFRRGKLDRFIAAHALATGLTIVTNNEADFADIPGLQIENWTQ